MKLITRLLNRLLTHNSPSPTQSAPTLEPIEGRLLMSTTLPTTEFTTTESPQLGTDYYKMLCGPDGQPTAQSGLPTESVSLNYTKVQLRR
jgi:hypothetical protein